ncbi:glycosyltransferase family 39 protein [Pseudoroseomonas cervicalis]|uniref:glycosyltransferase family 39 protein n=1 Tax=Teichococcus cervicalis TaxID=204525 RepID=UPI0022F1AFF2|nr:glycosyltransferase family 39 protein [Pseudoroseomonas cervicalis]WBV41551.1 glycosyltransferase family 39 protein [Pseudoroseomonas cervicalis]
MRAARNPWLLALLGLTALRLLAALWLPPAPDEAYYWVWGRALAPSYYDHPPMVAIWTALGSLVAGDNAFGLRLLGPIGVAIASVLLAQAGESLWPGRRVGVWAAALLNGTLLLGAGSVLMTPDTPLLVFWCAAIWALARLQAGQDGRWWLAFGLLSGCALLSKYTAVLLGGAVVLWLLAEPRARHWLRSAWLWLGGTLAMLVFSPVLWWNATHHWASFAKQGGRAGATATGSPWRYLGELLGGQAGLVTPIIFVLCVAGTVAACRRWWRGDAGAGLLAALTVPAALLFLWQATGSRVQGNWPAILYPSACLAAAACLGPGWDRWRRWGVALGLGLTLVVLVQAALAPLPLPRRSDPTLARLGGWAEFAREVEAARRQAGAQFVAAEEYGLASELALHLPPGVAVVALGDRWDLFDLDAPAEGLRGLLVRSERRSGPPLWPGAVEQGGVTRSRKGIEAERYRLHGVVVTAGTPPLALLPPRR